MPDFARNAVTIAMAGIYDLRLHHDEVVTPILRFWRVFERDDLGPGRRAGARGARRVPVRLGRAGQSIRRAA